MLADHLPCHPATFNSGYGNATALRDTPTGRGPQHEPGSKRDTSVWPPGPEPVPHTAHHALGDNRPDLVLDGATINAGRSPAHLRRLTASLPEDVCREMRWRE